MVIVVDVKVAVHVLHSVAVSALLPPVMLCGVKSPLTPSPSPFFFFVSLQTNAKQSHTQDKAQVAHSWLVCGLRLVVSIDALQRATRHFVKYCPSYALWSFATFA